MFIDVQEDLWEDTPDACNHYAREDKVGIWKDWAKQQVKVKSDKTLPPATEGYWGQFSMETVEEIYEPLPIQSGSDQVGIKSLRWFILEIHLVGSEVRELKF